MRRFQWWQLRLPWVAHRRTFSFWGALPLELSGDVIAIDVNENSDRYNGYSNRQFTLWLDANGVEVLPATPGWTFHRFSNGDLLRVASTPGGVDLAAPASFILVGPRYEFRWQQSLSGTFAVDFFRWHERFTIDTPLTEKGGFVEVNGDLWVATRGENYHPFLAQAALIDRKTGELLVGAGADMGRFYTVAPRDALSGEAASSASGTAPPYPDNNEAYRRFERWQKQLRYSTEYLTFFYLGALPLQLDGDVIAVDINENSQCFRGGQNRQYTIWLDRDGHETRSSMSGSTLHRFPNGDLLRVDSTPSGCGALGASASFSRIDSQGKLRWSQHVRGLLWIDIWSPRKLELPFARQGRLQEVKGNLWVHASAEAFSPFGSEAALIDLETGNVLAGVGSEVRPLQELSR